MCVQDFLKRENKRAGHMLQFFTCFPVNYSNGVFSGTLLVFKFKLIKVLSCFLFLLFVVLQYWINKMAVQSDYQAQVFYDKTN